MAVPTTAVNICNLALDRLGQRSIVSITAATTEVEEVCARHYDSTRRELLRLHIFNFAKKLAVLTATAGVGLKTPAFGYTASYLLPTDFIRLLALGDVAINGDLPPGLYEFSEGYLFTDYGDSGTLDISYIYDAETVSKWDSLFVRLMTLHLAKNMAYKFVLKNSLILAIAREITALELSAAAVAGQEKPPRRIERSKLRSARRFGRSGTQDNTRYNF